MAKKQMILYGVAALFAVSGIGALPSGNITGGVGCLVIAAVCAFSARKKKETSIVNNAKGNEQIAREEKINVNTYENSKENSIVKQPKREPEEPQEIKADYVFIKFKVAGVTFKNEDNTDRQTILRAIKFRDKPYETGIDLEIKEYQFNGELAYGIFANDKQIGNVPKKDIDYIKENFSRIEAISNISVYGGGIARESGAAISFGAEITLKIKK